MGGAIREQMDALDADGIPYDDTPGVSSFCGAAAALCAEYTLPNVSQTVIITRMEGRTPVPEKEKLAKPCRPRRGHGDLPLHRPHRQGAGSAAAGRSPPTPAAVVYKATWPEQKIVRCTVGSLAGRAPAERHHQTAPSSWWGIFSAPGTSAASSTTPPLLPRSAKEPRPVTPAYAAFTEKGGCGCWPKNWPLPCPAA